MRDLHEETQKGPEMNDTRFQMAAPALPISNRVPPIKVNVTRPYGHENIPPILTFFISTAWLREEFGLDQGIRASFGYDKSVSPPVGMMQFGPEGTELTPGGAHQWKANFYGWPGLDPHKYKSRSSCPLIEVTGKTVYFHIPPNKETYNPNTGGWEVID